VAQTDDLADIASSLRLTRPAARSAPGERELRRARAKRSPRRFVGVKFDLLKLFPQLGRRELQGGAERLGMPSPRLFRVIPP